MCESIAVQKLFNHTTYSAVLYCAQNFYYLFVMSSLIKAMKFSSPAAQYLALRSASVCLSVCHNKHIFYFPFQFNIPL
jgi:hypothetical protein